MKREESVTRTINLKLTKQDIVDLLINSNLIPNVVIDPLTDATIHTLDGQCCIESNETIDITVRIHE